MINRVNNVKNYVPIRNIIVSVADKTGIESFIQNLGAAAEGLRVFSTGGTYKALEKENRRRYELINIAEYTGQPEMQGGLVKTLDFKIYTGILSEPGNSDHTDDLRRIKGVEFDMIVVNLYPFIKTVEQKGCTMEDARSNIDIGGPCMLRASAKNYLRVASVCDPRDYQSIAAEVEANGGSLCLNSRLALAKKSFRHTAEYDAAIAGYLEDKNEAHLASDYTLD